MQTIKASEFKARCLRLMEEVNESGDPLVITKNGKPISVLMPYREKPSSLFGLHQGQVVSGDDIISPIGEAWDADAAD